MVVSRTGQAAESGYPSKRRETGQEKRPAYLSMNASTYGIDVHRHGIPVPRPQNPPDSRKKSSPPHGGELFAHLKDTPVYMSEDIVTLFHTYVKDI